MDRIPVDKYKPDRYHRQVKKIKSMLRRYPEEAILEACINYLYAPADDHMGYVQRQPWIALLVIKWTFMQKGPISYRRDPLTNNEFMKILNLTHDLGKLVRMPSNYTSASIFMKNMAFQQFIYQAPFSMSQYARQSMLFGHLPENNKLSLRFQQKHRLSCAEFISLSFVVVACFTDMKKAFFERSFLATRKIIRQAKNRKLSFCNYNGYLDAKKTSD